MFLSQAIAVLNAYKTQHTTASTNLQTQRQLLASQQATLATLIATRAPSASIQSQLNTIQSTQSNILSVQNSIKSLNDSRASAEKVVVTNINTTYPIPTPNPFPQSVFTGVTGPKGATGLRGIPGYGPQGPPGEAGNLSGFDSTPTLGSQKAVTSAGIYTAIQNLTSGGSVPTVISLPSTGTLGSLLFLKQPTFNYLVKTYSASMLGPLANGTSVSYWGGVANSFTTHPTYNMYPIPCTVFTGTSYFQDPSLIPVTFSSTGFTIIARFCFTGTSATYRPLFEVSNTTAGSSTMKDNVFLGVYNNQIRLALYNGANSVSSSTPILWGTLNPNQWTTIAITYDNTNNTLSAYQDGVNVFIRSDITALADRITTLNYLGRDAPTTSAFFSGSLNELSLYSKCFSSSEIASYTQASDYMGQRGGTIYVCTSSSTSSNNATWKRIKT